MATNTSTTVINYHFLCLYFYVEYAFSIQYVDTYNTYLYNYLTNINQLIDYSKYDLL